MPSKRTSQTHDVVVPWPFTHKNTDLNRDTSLLKIIAMVTMFCDHAGKMLFPQYPIMRLIGRIAFPIYCYCIAVGCIYTHDILRYVKRLVFVALLSQPIYAVALGHTSSAMTAIPFSERPVQAVVNFYVQSWHYPNILLTLTLGLLVIWSIRERHLVFTCALLLLCWWMKGKINYGFNGILLIVLFYMFSMKWWLSLPIVLAFMVHWGLQGSGYTLFDVHFGSQMFAVLALPLIYIHTHTNIRINKWVFYLFYPGHMIAIWLLGQYVLK